MSQVVIGSKQELGSLTVAGVNGHYPKQLLSVNYLNERSE